MKKTWWKESIIYQIYPRSFNDSNNDGIGDIRGIIQKLDHVERLGVDVIWLSPVYDSPNDDNGYDVRDYYTIMDEFGTMEDFDEMLKIIHEKGMKLIIDLVANHTSDEHAWFLDSKSSTSSDKRDFYIWKTGDNGTPPNNWRSFFGGNAWQYDETSKQYYLHLFSRKQPDLNWENEQVRQEMFKMMNWWLEKGVDGFRMDVISLISKRDFEDTPSPYFVETVQKKYSNGPKIGQYLEEMNQASLSHYDVMTVGEGPGIGYDQALEYVAEDKKRLNMIFHFDHMFLDHGPNGRFDPVSWDFKQFKKIFAKWDGLVEDGGWPAIFLGNHDFPRIVSRFGSDGKYQELSAKAICLMLMTMRGTPYVYQGDEIGMTNITFRQIEEYRDVETLNAYKEVVEKNGDIPDFIKSVISNGRDNARTPIQWSSDEQAGFSKGEPWIKVNPNHTEINVADQEEDSESVLNFYRKAIATRKRFTTLTYGDFELIEEEHPSVFAYKRSDSEAEFLVVINFSGEELEFETGVQLDSSKILVSNYPNIKYLGTVVKMQPWEAFLMKC